MFDKQEIINDFKELLTAIPNVFSMGENKVDDAKYPAVAIDVSFTPSFLVDTGVNSGYYNASIELDCVSYLFDDPDRSGVNALLKSVLLLVNQTDIVQRLNDVSTYYVYRGVNHGDNFEADEEKLRHEVIQLKVITSNRTTN